MHRVVFGIFAHPDDEAFGPSGTLYQLAHSGHDVHLILLTDGNAGRNDDNHDDLAATRLAEWQASAKLIGAASTTALGYGDGTLNNNRYLEIANRVLTIAEETLHSYVQAEVEFMTFDPNGISGHLDHIAAAHITTYVFLKLRHLELPGMTIARLRYFCIPDTTAPHANAHWLYMPKGRSPKEIDEVRDISDIADVKRAIMQAHHSQRDDMEAILGMSDDPLRRECFMHYKD